MFLSFTFFLQVHKYVSHGMCIYVYMYIYKITKIVRALWLAERRVCMRVCKHTCVM